jgi:hypothetical protein
MTAKTENRRPHTVYLTDKIWDALDRLYLETRLNSTTPPSKIEFIEQVLEAGMETLAAEIAGRSSAEDDRKGTTQAVQETAEKATADADRTNAPNLSRGTQQDEQEMPQTTSPATPLPRHQASRRSSALERLVRASEPGRPAPINSAATSDNQEIEQ